MVTGVSDILDQVIETPEQSHAAWLRFKEADGWKYGPEKDLEKKIHPNMLSYDKLTTEQRSKDYVFFGIVRALRFVTGSD